MGPLTGLRILDLSTLIAGPFASTLLADLGAEVLKIELPDGRDALRALPPFKDGIPLWWKVTNRNKRGITLDVRTDEGRAIFLELLAEYDVLVENFRSGTLDGWGLDAATLRRANPELIVLRVTGFGQTGPDRRRPGFARMFEALSGYTYISGPPDKPPSYNGYPIGDAVTGLFGALGILAAVQHARSHPGEGGQDIDLSATEAMLRLLDFLPIEYDQLGVVRERHGNTSAYNAPVDTYMTADGKWISVHAGTQPMWERLAGLMERPDLAKSPDFIDNDSRVRNREKLNAIVAQWMLGKSYLQLSALLAGADIAHCPIQSIADVFVDPQMIARGSIVRVEDPSLGVVRMQGVVPRFEKTPGSVCRTGPDLGQDNETVYASLGIADARLQELCTHKVI
jgi:crotonobetainyl-CoA:carnitine CoA-transferase CaiB-like acyl-CoA transferase